MLKQKELAQAAHTTIDVTVQGSIDHLAANLHPTEFLGYSNLHSSAIVAAVLVGGEISEEAEAGATVQIILDRSPFYAESGGQIGDCGFLTGTDLLVQITDVQKESNFFIHFGTIERGSLRVGDQVTAQIDASCRRRAQANHSATHLLQAALKKLVDGEISQAGSMVAFDRLRFDFNCSRALTLARYKPWKIRSIPGLVKLIRRILRCCQSLRLKPKAQ